MQPEEKTLDRSTLLYYFYWVVGISSAFVLLANFKSVGGPLLWLMASAGGGSGVGFLLAVPKVNTLPVKESSAATSTEKSSLRSIIRPNTNLEEISDWLTKIIVGLTLINFQAILRKTWNFSQTVGNSLSVPAVIILAILILGAIIGMIFGFLFTRIYLQNIINHADRQLSTPDSIVKEAASELEKQGDSPEVASKIAEGVAAKIPNNPDAILQQIRELSREYVVTRGQMPAGTERTVALERVVLKMKTLADAGKPFLDELRVSNQPGEQLAAIAILQVYPQKEYLSWLGTLCENGQPFIGYQAVLALEAAARQLGKDASDEILAIIATAKSKLSGSPKSDRYSKLEQIERSLKPQEPETS